MADFRISDLTTATSVNDTDLVEISQVDGNSSSGYATKKTTILAIAIKILKGISFSDLATTSKQIINAINELKNGKVDASKVGTAGGVAELDSSGHVPASQLPSSVDDIVEGYYYNGKFYEEDTHQTEIPAEAGKIYIDLTSNNTYRWGGSVYVEISPSLSLGETSTTAYRGDRGKTAYDHATESGRETTGAALGLYKISVTPEGHVGAGPTAATKSDFTAMGLLGEIDDALSSTSENPVKNNALYTAFQGKENKSDMDDDVTDIVVGLTDTQTATGNPVTITTVQEGLAKSAVVEFSPIQSGAGEPSPENVRPISGRDSLVFAQAGKNRLAKPFVYDDSVGFNLTDYFFINAGTYIFSFDTISATSWRYVIRMKDKNGDDLSDEAYIPLSTLQWSSTRHGWINRTNITNKTCPLTFVIDCYIRITFAVGDTSASTTVTKAQLEIGSSATAYEEYKGQTHTATFPDTVYGGKVVWKDGVVKAVIDKVSYTFDGTETMTSGTNNRVYAAITGILIPTKTDEVEVICSHFNGVSYDDRGGGKDGVIYKTQTNDEAIAFRDSTLCTSLNTFINYLTAQYNANTPVTIVYKLATPQEITLTPDTIALLKGNNILWTDGDNIIINYAKLPQGNLGVLVDYIQQLEARVKVLEEA